MFEGVIYFYGPRTKFACRIDDREIIWRSPRPLPWRWLARYELRSQFKGLDGTRCGYALLENGIKIDEHVPRLEDARPEDD